MHWSIKLIGYAKVLTQKNTAYQPTRIKSSTKSRKFKTTSQTQNNSMLWPKKASKRAYKMQLRLKISDALGLKLFEYFSRNNHLFLPRWTCLKKHTISWWAKYGLKSKRLVFCTRFFPPSCLWEKWNHKQSTLPILKRTHSQHPSKKSSILTVFRDTKKSTLLCTQSQFFPSCLELCSVMLDTVAAC